MPELPETLTIRGRRPYLEKVLPVVWDCDNGRASLTHDGAWTENPVDRFMWPDRAAAMDACYQFADLPPGWRITKVGDAYLFSRYGLAWDGSRQTAREAYLACQAAAQPAASERLHCHRCGKAVSTPVPNPTVVRAFIECPECIEAERPEAGWRPISTAPKDGTAILLHGRDVHQRRRPGPFIASWSGDWPGDENRYWRCVTPGLISEIAPTHWLPVPPPPAATEPPQPQEPQK